jgi:hypothetical protein
MPTRPIILANGTQLSPIGSVSESSFTIGQAVALTLQSTTGYTSFAWSLVGRPTGSAAALSATAGYTSSLTADVAGEYRIKGTATGADGTASTRVSVVIVKTPNRQMRKVAPAMGVALETRMADLEAKYNASLDTIDSVSLVSGTRQVADRAALKALSAATLANNDIVASAGLASATDGDGGTFKWIAASVTADDATNVIALNSGGTGRFHRVTQGPSASTATAVRALSTLTGGPAFNTSLVSAINAIATELDKTEPACGCIRYHQQQRRLVGSDPSGGQCGCRKQHRQEGGLACG